MILALFCLSQLLLLPQSSAQSRGVMVQLFEWSHEDVGNECEEFLKPHGFSAVQISPPMEHITGSQWWTRYQPVTYNLTSRSGSPQQFQDMVKKCNDNGIEVIVDAVINHMAAGSGKGVAGSTYGNRQYPYYSPQDFHHYDNNLYQNCGVNDYTNKYNVQYCDLSGLPDLCTSCSYVQSTVANYINTMSSYGISGIRIDAAKHQDAGELSGITNKLEKGIYIVQEVIEGSNEAVTPDMYYGIGQVTEFNYANFLDPNIKNENKMIYLQDFGEKWGLIPNQYALAFLDNHDTQRNGAAQLTYKDGNLYTFASIFMLSWSYGNIRVMSSYYFTNTDAGPPGVGVDHGSNCMDGKNWVCEHRWGPITNMVRWHNTAGTNAVMNWQVGNNNQIAFSRGNVAFIALNRDSNSWKASGLKTGLPAGNYCNVITKDTNSKAAHLQLRGSCKETVTINSLGVVDYMEVPSLSVVALHINDKA